MYLSIVTDEHDKGQNRDEEAIRTWNDVMLSVRAGIPLAEVRKMGAEDYYTYLAVFDADEHVRKSIIKR